MSAIDVSRPAPKTDKECAAFVDELLAEMRRMNDQMTASQKESEKTWAEIEALKTQTRVILTSLGAKF